MAAQGRGGSGNGRQPADTDALIRAAVAAHQAGDLQQAVAGYAAALALRPGDPDLLHLSGVAAAQAGTPDRAVALIREAIARRGDVADFHAHLGNALKACGDADGAGAAYAQALTLQADHHGALQGLANLRATQGRAGEAAQLYRALIDSGGASLEVLLAYCDALIASGGVETAIDLLQQIDTQLPDHEAVNTALGRAHASVLDFAAAATAFSNAHRAATGIGTKTGTQAPRHGTALNLAGALIHLKQFDAAAPLIDAVLAADPDHARAQDAKGTLLNRRLRPGDALPFNRRAVALDPQAADYRYNLANTYRALGDYTSAQPLYEGVVAEQPQHADAWFNLSLILFERGRLTEAWRAHDWRWRASDFPSERRRLTAPRWQGEAIPGRRLMIWREQGLGDEILFASLLGWVQKAAKGARVIVECDRRLTGLLARSWPGIETRPPSFDPTTGAEPTSPDYDCHLPAADLAELAGGRLTAIDSAPYLRPDPVLLTKWRQRLDGLPAGLKVGICWRSGLINDRRGAYTTLDDWAPVFALPGLTLVNLQYDDCAAELAATRQRYGVEVATWDDLDLKNDLDQVAALIAGLDLLISAPTSVAELGGAVGTPTWRISGMLGDWSNLGAACRPWFRATRAFVADTRRSGWQGTVLRRIASALAQSRPQQ